MKFGVKKTFDGESVQFKPIYKSNNKQGINFNYESIVDFTVDVKDKHDSVSYEERYFEEDDTLYAEIESNYIFLIASFHSKYIIFLFSKVTVIGEYLFQIISKKDQMPIPIKVFPKESDSYRIQFQPLTVSGYVLKAKSIRNLQSKSDQLSIGSLVCSFNNPKNLEINDLVTSNDILSFTGNL